MKSKWVCCVFILTFITGATHAQEFVDQLYADLKTEFELSNNDLESTLSEYEQKLIDSKVLADNTWESRKQYLQSLSVSNLIPIEDFSDKILTDLQLRLSLQPISVITSVIKESDSTRFASCAFNNMLTQIESSSLKDCAKSATIANAFLDNLNPDDYKHPFYRALFFMAVANLSDLNFRSKDFMLANEDDYELFFGDKYFILPRVDTRDEINIRVTDEHLVYINGIKLDNLGDLADQIQNCYLINRELTKEEMTSDIADRSSEGYNFPFYSNITHLELDQQIHKARANYIDALNQENTPQETIDNYRYTLDLWIEKMKFLLIYGKGNLPEISRYAQIRIFIDDNANPQFTYNVGVEVVYAITKMRNTESVNLSIKTSDLIYLRHNFLLNDFIKTRLLEVLFPMRVFANPIIEVQSGPPPIQESIIEED